MATSTDQLTEQLAVLARRRKALLESPPTWHTRRTLKDELYRLNADIDRLLDLFLSQRRPPSGEDQQQEREHVRAFSSRTTPGADTSGSPGSLGRLLDLWARWQ